LSSGQSRIHIRQAHSVTGQWPPRPVKFSHRPYRAHPWTAGSPQDRRAGAGFASGSALATDGSAAPYAAAWEFRAGAVYLATARSPAGRFPAGLAGRSGRIAVAGRSAAAPGSGGERHNRIARSPVRRAG